MLANMVANIADKIDITYLRGSCIFVATFIPAWITKKENHCFNVPTCTLNS